jgi:hypothetical protein
MAAVAEQEGDTVVAFNPVRDADQMPGIAIVDAQGSTRAPSQAALDYLINQYRRQGTAHGLRVAQLLVPGQEEFADRLAPFALQTVQDKPGAGLELTGELVNAALPMSQDEPIRALMLATHALVDAASEVGDWDRCAAPTPAVGEAMLEARLQVLTSAKSGGWRAAGVASKRELETFWARYAASPFLTHATAEELEGESLKANCLREGAVAEALLSAPEGSRAKLLAAILQR